MIGVTTYFDEPAKLRMYAFLPRDGNLYVNYWDGSKWQWANQGKPAATKLHSAPRAITYLELPNKNWIYAFAGGEDGNLYANYWDGTKWQWAQQGKPPGVEIWNEVSSVTYLTSSGKQWIHTFVKGKDNQLYNNFWDGTKWQWVGYGNPPTTMLASNPTAITFRDPVTGQEQIYVFSQGSDGNLYVNYGDISNRKWANLGKP